MSLWTRAAPFLVGHRGGRGPGWPPENTIAAFERAATEGAEAIELDVRLSAGGDVIVFHDAGVARVTAGARHDAVARLATGELRALARLDVPLLRDALGWARARRVAVNVELKHDGVPSRIALARGVARAFREEPADVLFSSFHPGILAAIALLAPDAPRAALTHARQGWTGVAIHALAGSVDAFHPEHVEITPARVARWKARGLRVGGWTVNTAAEAERLLGCGVDYLITDRPAELNAALARRL